MGFLKNLFGDQAIEVDPEALRVPDEIGTDVPGLIMRKGSGRYPVHIDIVGESFRSANVAAVAATANGQGFDIYLVNEPGNPHDKHAVAVYAANLPLGYIARPGNKLWFKWVNEAFQRGELLWGSAKAVSREGGSNVGIFGSIYMPTPENHPTKIEPQQLNNGELANAIAKVEALAASCDEPETISQLKSLCKKAVAVSTPIARHAKWCENNLDENLVEAWVDIYSICEDILTNAQDATYATDEDDVDAVSSLEELAEALEEMKPIS